MNVLIKGQEAGWTRHLAALCEREQIHVREKENTGEEIQLLVTDFPIETVRKGILQKIPFLVASKEKREEKILEAFQKGAEDYLILPISPEIAAVRIRQILKRYAFWQKNIGQQHEEIHFTPNEYRILSYMMRYPGKVFSRGELIEGALLEEYEGIDRNVDNYIKQIRKKIEDDITKPKHIQTVYGVGYRYVP